MKQKKLLVMGATPFQVPIVKKAQAKGHYVITMDNIPGNFAHHVSDETALVSIVECQKVLKFAIDEHIDGIMTGGSDVGVVTIGLICDSLRLPGVNSIQAATLTRKDLFREFQKKHNLSHPKFEVISDFIEFFEKISSLIGRYVIKPVDNSGSKGTSEIKLPFAGTPDKLNSIFENAMSYTRVGHVILEEFIDAEEHGGDAFVCKGNVTNLFVTTKHVSPYPHYVPVGHVIPTTLSASANENIRQELEKVIRLLGIEYGPLNFDVMFDKSDRATILEMSPRFGGNCIPQIIEHGTGFDEIGATIDYALNGSIGNIINRENDDIKPTGARILGISRNGKLQSIEPRQKILESFNQNILELVYDVEIGDSVSEFIQGNYRIGHFIASAETLPELDVIMKNIEDKINIQVS